jgi:hypothetical protein
MLALEGETAIDLTLLLFPPFAKLGATDSGSGGADDSEHAANTNATVAATVATNAMARCLMCISLRCE